jgi:hypothetical protein
MPFNPAMMFGAYGYPPMVEPHGKQVGHTPDNCGQMHPSVLDASLFMDVTA